MPNLNKLLKRILISNKQFYLNKFYKKNGFYPDIENPTTFNEKILWLSLNYRDELIKFCSDKIKVREYIKDKVGDKYNVPILKITKKLSEITPEKLPNEPFVLKTNHDQGGVLYS